MAKEREARAMIEADFVPVTKAAGAESTGDVLVVSGQRSAAKIADAIVKYAHDANAAILVVISHGGGLRADYGSVARYCVQHFKRAILLVPPAADALESAAAAPSVAVAVNTLAELQDATTWAVQNVVSESDRVRVLRAEEQVLQASSSNDQTSIMLGLHEQVPPSLLPARALPRPPSLPRSLLSSSRPPSCSPPSVVLGPISVMSDSASRCRPVDPFAPHATDCAGRR